MKPTQTLVHRNAQVVDDAELDAFVLRLHREAQRSALDLALTIGALIIDQFYGGRLDLWRQRGRKDASFRKLASRRDLPMSSSALYRAVAIYELWSRTRGLSAWKHLGSSHFRAVLPLPAPDQESLLQLAEEKEWSVRDLEVEVRKIRDERFERRGRPRLPRVVKDIRALDKALAGFDPPPRAEVRRLEPELVDELRARISKMRRYCATLERHLAE